MRYEFHPEAEVDLVETILYYETQSLRVDAEVLAWFQAQGPGYQTRINAVLKAFTDASL